MRALTFQYFNTDGSFTVAVSNSSLSLLEILLLAQENKYLDIYSRTYMLCGIKIASSMRIQWLHSTYHYFNEDRKHVLNYDHLPTGDIAQRSELHMSRTNFHGPKDVRAIRVRLYVKFVIVQMKN